MILTSYFAKAKSSVNPVSVANSCPKSMKFDKYYPLVLSWNEIVKPYKDGKISEKEYTKLYNVQLEQLDVDKIAQKLNNHTLLCWEAPDKFYHRHLIAKWLMSHGYPCKEIAV